MGTSIAANINSYSYRLRSMARILNAYPQYASTFTNIALSGHNTWSNLVRLSELLSANPDLIILDTVNDGDTDKDKAALEAFIRRILTTRPMCRLLGLIHFTVADQDVNANVNSPTNSGAITNAKAVYGHYSIPILDTHAVIQNLVNNLGHDLNEYLTDTVHLSADGHDVDYDLIEPYLPNNGGGQVNPLPARLYAASADYENASTRKNGTAYDSRNGTWSDNGTSTSSSQAGATITYSATCQSFGAYRSDGGTNNVEISIDGGAFSAASFYQNGVEIAGGRATHTITARVVSGTVRIDEFWAI